MIIKKSEFREQDCRLEDFASRFVIKCRKFLTVQLTRSFMFIREVFFLEPSTRDCMQRLTT